VTSGRISGSIVGIPVCFLGLVYPFLGCVSSSVQVAVAVVCCCLVWSVPSLCPVGVPFLRRSALIAFSAAFAELIFPCSFRTPTLCLLCSARSLASAACFCCRCFRRSEIYLSSGDILSLPLVGGVVLWVKVTDGCCSAFGC